MSRAPRVAACTLPTHPSLRTSAARQADPKMTTRAWDRLDERGSGGGGRLHCGARRAGTARARARFWQHRPCRAAPPRARAPKNHAPLPPPPSSHRCCPSTPHTRSWRSYTSASASLSSGAAMVWADGGGGARVGSARRVAPPHTHAPPSPRRLMRCSTARLSRALLHTAAPRASRQGEQARRAIREVRRWAGGSPARAMACAASSRRAGGRWPSREWGPTPTRALPLPSPSSAPSRPFPGAPWSRPRSWAPPRKPLPPRRRPPARPTNHPQMGVVAAGCALAIQLCQRSPAPWLWRVHRPNAPSGIAGGRHWRLRPVHR